MINQLVDHTFVINLDERTDRLEEVTKELGRFKIDFERFPAIKPKREDISSDQYCNMIGRVAKDSYVVATCGVRSSHVEVIKIAKERKYNSILILEDDVEFKWDYEDTLRLSIYESKSCKIDMLFLGANHVEPFRLVSPHLCKVVRAYAIHAYIISEGMYDVIIDGAISSGKEIDVYYADDIFPNYECYCVRPHIVWQKEGHSDVLNVHKNYDKVLKA